MSKLIRVLIYEGDEDALAEHFHNMRDGPGLNGNLTLAQYSITSIVVEAQDIPCVVCDKLTNNKTLVCEDCEKSAKRFATFSS